MEVPAKEKEFSKSRYYGQSPYVKGSRRDPIFVESSRAGGIRPPAGVVSIPSAFG